jgi:hypothetical protein
MKNAFLGIVLLSVLCAIVYAGTDAQLADENLTVYSASTRNAPQKIVPILSVGSGTRVGGALVTGPSQSTLNKVVAVAQIEGSFSQSVRVRALIPVSTVNVVQKISRVPGASVIGLVDIRI